VILTQARRAVRSVDQLLYARLFPRWRPRGELRPSTRAGADAVLRIRWLGTAGHVIESARTTLLIDPFFSRPSLPGLLRPLVPDERAIFSRLPRHIDAILCGHSHYDHLLDAPTIARATGALLVGSQSTCMFARASGVPEQQLVCVPPSGERLTVGDFAIRFVPSLHGRVLFGRVPFVGEVSTPPPLPARTWHYKMGGAFGLMLEAHGVRVYHNGSADLVDAELEGERADVLLAGLAGRQATPGYLARLCDALAPKLIVPTHHDAFFAPLDRGVHLLPGIDLDGFVAEARRRAPRARVITPDYDEPIAVPGDASASALLA
jgi:L-ascorbate metabolism protein UlaG (beta-lactamase superfamily)